MKSSNIGGQAVLEGIMMRNEEKYAVAVKKRTERLSLRKIRMEESPENVENLPKFRLSGEFLNL